MPYTSKIRTLTLTAMAALMFVGAPLAIASAAEETTAPVAASTDVKADAGKQMKKVHAAKKVHKAKKAHKAAKKAEGKVEEKASTEATPATDYKVNQ